MELHRKYHKEQLKSITDFAESLYADVLEQNSSATISENKLNTLNQNIDIAVQITQIHEPSIRTELDTVGTKLWNACTRTMRKDGLETATIEFLSRARGFAFLMLECAVGRQREDCSVLNQLDIGLKILEKAALREKQLSKGPKDSGEKNDIPLKLSAEYYILRSNLVAILPPKTSIIVDYAEHMLSKLPRQVLQQDVALTERLSDLLFDIGKNLMDRKEYADAEKWLQRALDALSQEPLDMLTPDARELRLCILYGLVRVNLDLKYTNSETKAMDLHIVLEKEYGHRLEVLLLGLDVIQAQKSPDSQRYYDQLGQFSKGLATDVLEQLLLQRFASHGIENLIERGFITYIWMKTASPGVDDGLESLRTVVAKLTETWKSRLSGEATHAALILIWKKVTAAFDVKEYGSAQSWCQLALHPIFGNAGESNISKIKSSLYLIADLEKKINSMRTGAQ
ncbi:sporulation-specific protein 22 [Emydomyces testavorans]|uniref:Sporulation-specific protein 22 n=1 Tax=Emydomyces testavorans TaxID=2070801 RepID=A0AAF0DEP1_9EURO|nr:sporulation-specific protein 22 [Emydomyces testavorans]